MVPTAMLRKERLPREADVVPIPSDYPSISSSPLACFKFISSLSPPFQKQFSSQQNGCHLISLALAARTLLVIQGTLYSSSVMSMKYAKCKLLI